MKQRLRLVMSAVLTCGLIACGNQPPSEDSGVPTYSPGYHFITFGPSIYGLVGAAKKEAVTICVSGATASTLPKWTAWITDSVLKWLKPMRQWTTEAIAERVAVVTNNQNCDATFRIVPGQWGYAQISNKPAITVGPQVPFGVVIHEFGHAFGLSDTYQNGQSGNCRPGQPQSMMCNISFSDLQADDVAGLKVVFGRRFPNDQPPPAEPPSEPSEPSEPPQNEPSNPDDPGEPDGPADPGEPAGFAYLALEPTSTENHYFLNVSVEDSLVPSQVSYCVGSQAACADTGAVWLSLNLKKQEQGRTILRSYESLGVVDNTLVTLKSGAASEVTQLFTIKRNVSSQGEED